MVVVLSATQFIPEAPVTVREVGPVIANADAYKESQLIFLFNRISRVVELQSGGGVTAIVGGTGGITVEVHCATQPISCNAKLDLKKMVRQPLATIPVGMSLPVNLPINELLLITGPS